MEILSDPTPDMLAMPRFDDGAIDMQELLRRLAEQVVNAVMDAEADQLCGGGANSRNGYRERSLALCNAQLNLDAAYRNFFRRVKAGEKHGFPKYKAKHRSRCCYKTNFVNGNIRFEGDERYLRLPKLGSVRVRQKRGIARQYWRHRLP